MRYTNKHIMIEISMLPITEFFPLAYVLDDKLFPYKISFLTGGNIIS